MTRSPQRAVPIDYSRSVPHEGVRRRAAFGSTRSLLDARGCPTISVRGHRLWTAVKVRGRRSDASTQPWSSSVYAAIGRAPRAGSYVVPCFHIAYSTCASLRASAMIATCAPRRVAICLAHCTIGSLRPMQIERPGGLSERPSDLRGARACQSRPLGPKAGRVLPGNEAQIRRDAGGIGKPVDVIQRRDESRGRHRADARHRHQPPHADVFAG